MVCTQDMLDLVWLLLFWFLFFLRPCFFFLFFDLGLIGPGFLGLGLVDIDLLRGLSQFILLVSP